MSRQYDSSRRKQQARRTRGRILDAAVELHSQGITAYEPLAESAGVSLATVRQHFPNKEVLFQGCTRHFFETFEPPRLEDAAGMRDPRERVAGVVGEMCRAHETTHDLVWHSHAEARNSPALASALDELAAAVHMAADVVIDGPGLRLRGKSRERARASVRALLDPITYRAFRVHAGFDADGTRSELTALVGAAVSISVPDSSQRSKR